MVRLIFASYGSKRGSESKRNGRSRVFVKPISPIFSWRRVRVKLERRSGAYRSNLQKRCANVRLWSGFLRRLPGRFLGFAPISSVSPQNRSKFGPIYQAARERGGNWAECSTESASIIECWAQGSI